MINIAILGWADLAKGTAEGGGYNHVAKEHALNLKHRGHNVFYLQSGRDYTYHWLFGIPGRYFIKLKNIWNGIHCYSFYNSMNRAPSVMNHHNMAFQISDVAHSKAITKWIAKNKIKKLYIHSHEGFSFCLVQFIKEALDIPVFIFCHDHFYLCSQVNLLYKGREICFDAEGKEKCESCISSNSNKSFEKSRFLETSKYPFLRTFHKHIINYKLKRNPFTILFRPENKPIGYDANNRFLGKCRYPNQTNMYSKRSKTAVVALNWADKVFTPSEFIRTSLEKSGVDSCKLVSLKLGLNHLDQLKNQSFHVKPDISENEPIIFCYRGSELSHKGLAVFLDSLAFIPLQIRRQCRFIVRGVEDPSDYLLYMTTIEELEIKGRYSPDELTGFIEEYHIGIVPHIWFENSPVVLLEHLASGKPVLTSKLGGVTDYIREGKNGWYFRGGDSKHLAEKIAEIVNHRNIPLGGQISQIVQNSDDFFQSLD